MIWKAPWRNTSTEHEVTAACLDHGTQFADMEAALQSDTIANSSYLLQPDTVRGAIAFNFGM